MIGIIKGFLLLTIAASMFLVIFGTIDSLSEEKSCSYAEIIPVTQSNPPVTDLFIKGIEITQAIQCFGGECSKCPDNSLELTDGKPTIVRVYIGHKGGPDSQNPETPVLKNLRVTIGVVAPHIETPGSVWLPANICDLFDLPCTNDLKQMRENSWGSATFLLPSEVMGKPSWKKTLYVHAKVEASGIQESDYANNEADAQVSIVPRKALNVEWIPIYYNPDNYHGSVYADTNKMVSVSSFMENIFPTPINYFLGPGPMIYGNMPGLAKCPDCPSMFDASDVNPNAHLDEAREKIITRLSYIRMIINPQPDVLIGWLPSGANGGGMSEDYGYAESSMKVAYCIQGSDEKKNQLRLAHEVAHTQEIPHEIEGKLGETGFDVANRVPISASTLLFNQENAPSDSWISPCIWNKLIKKPCSGGDLITCSVTDPPENRDSIIDGNETSPAIFIDGWVNDNGTGKLGVPYPIISKNPFSVSSDKGNYSLEFQTSEGSPLVIHRFDPSFVNQESGKNLNSTGFFFMLPFPDKTQRIVLKQGLNVLAERTASSHPPKLAIVSSPGEEAVRGKIKISWKASDDDGDNLQFAVFYSHNNGNSWWPLVLGMEGTSFEINSSLLAGGISALIRVVANDGFRTTTVDSSPFIVAQKTPNVWINTPTNGSRIDALGQLILGGYADDLEDGKLNESSLVWKLDNNRILGKGSQIFLPATTLGLGRHEVTLFASDSDGNTGTATAEIIVNDASVLPDLTGIYYGNSNGIFYVRQIGSNIYWYGQENSQNPLWSNIAFGTISGHIIMLNWADVPKGKTSNSGTLTLIVTYTKPGIVSSDGKIRLNVTQQTGGYGGTELTRTILG